MMAGSMTAQTDVTSTYLTNADFSQTTPLDNILKGYGKDMGTTTPYYGLQPVDGWTAVVTSGDNSNASYPNSGLGGAVFEYGSDYQMQGNSVTAPGSDPDNNAGQGLGFFAVWSCGGYYYQDVTLPAGDYTIEIPMYNKSGSSATTSYFGFIPTSGTAQTIKTPTTTGSWLTQTTTFTLTEETEGQIRVGYKSNGNGSAANPMLYIDKVTILYTALEEDELEQARLTEAQSYLNEAIETAEQLISKTETLVGTELFTYKEAELNTLKGIVSDAQDTYANETNVDVINDATQKVNKQVEVYKLAINTPVAGQAYGLVNVSTGFYLNLTDGVKITEDSYAIQFIAEGTGWLIASIRNTDVRAGMAGTNSWSMSNNKSTAWTINPVINDGVVVYTIQGPNGLIGTDNTTSGSTCYGNKAQGNNGTWTIVEIDAIGIAKSELSEAILTATTFATNNPAGDQPLCRPTEALATLQDAIDNAQAVYDNAESTIVQLETAAQTLNEALNTYKDTAVLPLDATKKYTFINVSEDYGMKGNALTFKSASGADLTASTTSMGYTELPGSVYPQAVTLTPVDGVENGYTFSYTRADGNVVYASTGITSGLGSNANQIRPTTDAEKALTIQLQPTATVGVYKLYNTEANNTIGANGTTDTGFFTTAQFNDFSMVEAIEAEVELNITAENQYATIVVPFDTELPAGVEAYTVTGVDGTTVTLETAASLKANTPYVLYAEEGVAATLAGLGAAYTDATYTEGLLTGGYAATTAPADTYVLQNQSGNVAFYVVEAEGKEVPAYHAYLTAPAADVKAYGFGGIATAIQNLTPALAAGEGAIYNVNGQQMETLQKGINIVGGKKVLVK